MNIDAKQGDGMMGDGVAAMNGCSGLDGRLTHCPGVSKRADTIRVLFVCHGNICRSAMAQCVMQKLVDDAGWSSQFTIDSAATTAEEIGNPIYPPARAKLEQENVPIIPHRARRVLAGEQVGWDHIVVMDEENVRHLKRIWGPENMGKVRKLLSFIGEERDVADPWYTRDFDATYDDVLAGCTALLVEVLQGNRVSEPHIRQ